MQHTLLQPKNIPWGALHGGDVLWKMTEFGLTVSAWSYTQLTLLTDDDDCKFTELCTSDAWEIQDLIKSDFERKNGDQFFPVS